VPACVLLLFCLNAAEAATARLSPADLEGTWSGRATHESDACDFGLRFARGQDGRVLARVWMPCLNSYGSAIGWVTANDTGWVVPEAPLYVKRKGKELTGTFYQSTLRFTVHRADSLPHEPAPPSVSKGPTTLWSYRAGAPLWATPAIANGVAYFGDAAGRFHAVRVADGRALWTFEAGTPLFGGALVTNDAIYFLGDSGELFRLRRDRGSVVWRVPLAPAQTPRVLPSNEAFEWDFASPTPVLVGKTLYLGTADGACHAIDSGNGRPVWRVAVGGKIRASGAVLGDRLFVGSLDHFVYALDRATGRSLWKFDTGSPVTSAPAIAQNRVLVGTRDRATLYALDPADGRVAWRHYFWLSWVESTPTLVDGLVYLGSSDSRRIRVLEPASGKLVWASQVWGWTWGTPLVVGDRVFYGTAGTQQYFITQRGSLGALDRKSGAMVWRRAIPTASDTFLSGYAAGLAHANGRVLAAGLDGTLIAFPDH
jgi:outer membrane protein assembly factor BamB